MAFTTIRVQFGNAATTDGGGASGHLSAEVDTRPNGLNSGKSSFSPGETVYVLVYKTDNVTIAETLCSAGSLSAQGTTLVTFNDEVMFEDAETATLRVPAHGGITSTTWYGRTLGTLAVQSDHTTVRAAVKGVGVAKVTYQAMAQIYALSSPASLNGETDFSILAIIKGTTA